MAMRWPGSDLAFAQVREDPAIEARVLAGREGARVLLICSGGCTALSMLALPHVSAIDAVDPNPTQLHLCELKRQAALRLTRPQVHALLGVTPATGEQRWALLERLRAALPPATRACWEARREQVEFGALQVGRFEELFRDLQRAFKADGLEPLARPAAALADRAAWRARFERVFERERLAATFGRAAVAYSMSRSFGEHFADVFARALERGWEGENPYLRQVWEDRYVVDPRAPWGLPDYLREPEALRRRPERLRLHLGRFEELFERLAGEGRYDLIQTSNISDWMPLPALEALIDRAARCLAPGGALLMRRLNGDHDLQALVAKRLDVVPAECAELLRIDRSFFYSEVVVGRVPR
jgi:S-adenosylmethionine-diacylglycerol 3-amino-3-carboxypropyl transferase